MSFEIINPSVRNGIPFQAVANAEGLIFLNCATATIAKGTAAAIDMASTAEGFANIIAINATSVKYPIVIAMADVGTQTLGAFAPCGIVNAIAAGAIKGDALTANSTGSGGNILIKATNAGAPACGFYASTTSSNGTTPDIVLFTGVQRGAMAGVALTAALPT